MPSPFSLENKSVLVSGGTRGVGRAITLAFARNGASVVANYVHDLKAATELLSLAEEEKLSIQCCRADISNDQGRQQLIDYVAAHRPMLSAFVHCAATGVHRPVEQLSLRHFDFTFALNVRAFFALVVQLLPKFEPGSSILAISSEGAAHAVPKYTLVGASKGALESMVRHLAAELAPKGIRVNALAPGTVLTDSWKILPDSEARLKQAVDKTPLQRLVTLEEVALAAQFLCSSAASGIVGQTIVVDGGARIMA